MDLSGSRLNSAPIITIFFAIYCPSNVGINIVALKVSSGKKIKGVKVMPIWTSAIIIIVFRYIWAMSSTPTSVSQKAKIKIAMEDGIRP